MFTRRLSRGETLTLRRDSVAETPSYRDKGKAVAFIDSPMLPPPPPPVRSLAGDREDLVTEDMEDWRRFKEAGLLDEVALERRDREALEEKASRLEKELFDYQHNMGLLLIEKNEWNSKFDKLERELEEVQEILKREHSAHLIAVSEVEQREENLKEALKFEKQCVYDLEKSLRELQEEHKQIKLNSEIKLADAKALVDGVKEKAVNVEEKLGHVEAKLAEANKMNLELDIKLRDLETRENAYQRERLLLNSEKEEHKTTFYRQREDLLEWEKKLQKREEWLAKLRRTQTMQEEKANEKDRVFKIKEVELKEIEQKIAILSSKLMERDDDINNKILNVTAKENEIDSVRSSLEIKENKLLALQEKLSAREKEEIQKLRDEHQGILDDKLQKLELELDERRKSLDDDLRKKLDALEQQEAELRHREEKLGIRDLALDKKSERLKEKEKDVGANVKSLKEREKSLKAEEKKIELEKKQLLTDKESFQILKDECENIRAEIAQKQVKITEERENLKVMNDERMKHLHLQTELMHQLKKCRQQEELILQEAANLKVEREKFDKEWELLEERRAECSKSEKEMDSERQKLERLQSAEQERLQKERCTLEEDIQRHLEVVRQEKESFEATMGKQRLALAERVQNEHDQTVQDIKLQKKNFEIELGRRREEFENDMHERNRSFNERKEAELKDIEHLKEVTRRELDEVQSKRHALEKENREVIENMEKLEEQQTGLAKDTEELQMLSTKLRGQREQVAKERNHFLAFVEKHMNCNCCGEIVGKFVLSDLNTPGVEDQETTYLSRSVDYILRKNGDGSTTPNVFDKSHNELDPGHSHSGGPMSWLRKCTSKIFSPSSSKKILSNQSLIEELPSSAVPVNTKQIAKGSGMLDKQEIRGPAIVQDETQLPSAAVDIKAVNRFHSDIFERQGFGADAPSLDDYSYTDSKAPEIQEESEQIEVSTRRKGKGKGKSGIGRTRSVKAVVEEATSFLGESLKDFENDMEVQPDDGNQLIDDTRGSPSRNGKAAGNTARKRQHTSMEKEDAADDSEGQTESANTGRRRKRQQTVVLAPETLGQKRYNLRRHKIEGTSGIQVAPPSKKVGSKHPDGGGDAEPSQNLDSAEQTVEPGKTADSMHMTVHKSMEVSQDRVVQIEASEIEQATTSEAMEITKTFEEINALNGNPEYENKDESGCMVIEDYNDDSEDDEPHSGESSIKKIWTFFTT